MKSATTLKGHPGSTFRGSACVCVRACCVCVRARALCACVRALSLCACVRALSFSVRVRARSLCVCACARCVCVWRAWCVCVCACGVCVCVRGVSACARRIKSVRQQRQEITGAGQRLTHHSNRGTSTSAPGSTRPWRDNAKEFATTHPNIEGHLRDQVAAAFPLSQARRGLSRKQDRAKMFAGLPQQRTAPPFRRDHHEACTSNRCRPTLGTCAPSFFVLPPMQRHPGPIRPDGRHQGGVNCQLGASQR